MSLVKKIGKAFPKLKRRYFENKRYREYLQKKKTPEKDFPELIMKEWEKRGRERFDLEHPLTYTQKIQWSEIYERTPLKAELTDKAAVRDWIKEKIGEEYLIPLIGVYRDPDEIDFDALPDRYVIKMNNASGFNIIVKDKAKADVKDIKKKLKKWLSIDYAFYAGLKLSKNKCDSAWS